MVVMIGHLSGHRLTRGFLWQFGPFMSEAVAVFFVLSGYVIAYSVSRPDQTASRYALDRSARIYSVAVPALVITLVLDTAGQALRPDLYTPDWGFDPNNILKQYLSGLVFVNQIWGLNILPGSALPYWSLGYEVWYYVFFGVSFFMRGPARLVGCALCLAIMGPNIIVLLPVWLLGAAAFWAGRHVQQRPRRGLALWCLSLCAWVAYEWTLRPLLPYAAVFNTKDIYNSYCVGVLFVLNLLAFQMMAEPAGALLQKAAPVIRYAAGATFTIYLLHLPIAQFLVAIMPLSLEGLPARAMIEGGSLLASFAVAEFTERRKTVWRRLLTTLIPEPAPTPRR